MKKFFFGLSLSLALMSAQAKAMVLSQFQVSSFVPHSNTYTFEMGTFNGGKLNQVVTTEPEDYIFSGNQTPQITTLSNVIISNSPQTLVYMGINNTFHLISPKDLLAGDSVPGINITYVAEPDNYQISSYDIASYKIDDLGIGVDKVVVNTTIYGNPVNSSSNVPEPSTILLGILSGIFVFVVIKR